jgi:hypothetical protein
VASVAIIRGREVMKDRSFGELGRALVRHRAESRWKLS